ncbi:hypothetical protein [Streptomyces sp. TLI_105]|uniref:hypothetical protein n=1 Tax=Streptomyces sp. TLI_105 TaxID=1881019 RepID=UPI000896B02F|nr:hypothetical protein [Streptomyces sp. TLI_105]SEE01661.1 hypothetical protein SAMN05428939_7057 [Streptomyces sp. TLI_105]
MPYFEAVLFHRVGTLLVPTWGPDPGRPRGARWIERTLLLPSLTRTRTTEERLHSVLGACGLAVVGAAAR